MREAVLFTVRGGPLVTYMFLDRLWFHAQADPKGNLLLPMEKAYRDCYAKRLSKAKAEKIAKALPQPKSEPSKQISHKITTKGLGTDYMQWLGNLPADRICYLLSGYDYEKAERLYTTVDYRVLQDMSEVYLENRWNEIQAGFEGSMYGFGGSYKDGAKSAGSGSSVADKVYDMTSPEGKKAAMSSLKSLGWA